MDINTFLKTLILNNNPYELTSEDKKAIQFEGIEHFIYKKLNSTKYKATKTTEDYDKKVLEKIKYCVEKALPIHIDLSTGATKNPNASTAPGIDWAEVFNFAFIREYLKPIAAAYKYGVNFDYFSVAVFEEKVNHIPQHDVDLYDHQFNELINYYKGYLPNNFRMDFKRLADRGDKQKIYAAMDKRINELEIEWPSLSDDVKNEKLKRAQRNIYFTDADINREKIIHTAALAHDAFTGECWGEIAMPIWNELDDISLGHRFTNGWAIHIRSTQGSTVNFWSGTGVLMQKGKDFTPTVLSPNQYKELASNIHIEETNFFSTNPILANKLNKIPVLSQS